MKINKIKKLSSGKYKIELENKESITLYEDVLLEENILYKKEIDNELLNKLNIRNDYYKIYTKTLKYIMTKIRSEKEINEYLDKQIIDKKDKEKIIKKLKDNKMLNDDNFYISYISDRIRLSNDGPDKIKSELIKHNIDENKINNELSKYEEAYKNDIIEIKIDKNINKNCKVVKTTDYKLVDLIDKEIKLNNRKIKINGTIKCKLNEPIILKISDGINNIEVKSDFNIEDSINNPTDKEDIKKQLNKLKYYFIIQHYFII